MLSGEQILKKVTAIDTRLFPGDSVFKLCKVNLVAAACPYGLAQTLPNQAQHLPIVIAKNRLNYGQLASMRFAPKGVIVCGMYQRDKMMKEGFLHAWAWVEEQTFDKTLPVFEKQKLAISIQAALNNAASNALLAKTGIPSDIVVSIFDNQVQYRIGTQVYRSNFELNCSSELVRLTGVETLCF